MKIVTIIPARGGSKSIHKKNLIDFCGKPLVVWSIEQAQTCALVNGVYVSTEDQEIAVVSKKYGAEVIQRPIELSTDTASSEDALVHAIDRIEKEDGRNIDIVVFLQATSPLRNPADIDNALRKFIDQDADSLFSGAILEDFLVWGEENGKLESINYNYRNRGLRQTRKKQYVENGSIYIFKPAVLRKENNRLGGKIIVYEMEFWKSYEIDSYEDIEICEYYMRNKLLRNAQQIRVS
jgi:N-acylneuraminate cytidylyltransferase